MKTNKKKVYKIRIIGAGLYGCLLAIQLKKKFKKRIDIEILENSKNIISNYKSINLSGIKLNNGFHGIEYPRARDLIQFLKKDLNVNLIKSYNKRLICVENFLLDYCWSLSEWPTNLKNFFKSNKNESIKDQDLKKIISNNYIHKLKKIGQRYSHNFSDIKHHFIPWFLPSNYKLISNDEGDKFRNKVRTKKIVPFFYFPKNGLFESLQKNFKDNLIKRGIKIHFNSSIVFNEKNYIVSNENKKNNLFSEVDYTFFTASSPLLLNNFEKKLTSKILNEKRYLVNKIISFKKSFMKKKFTEIIFANSEIPNLLRVSNTPNIKKSKSIQYLQIEMIFKNKKIYYFDQKLKVLLSKILAIPQREIFIHESMITRTLFFPKKIDKDKATSLLKLKLKNYKNFNHRYIFGPPNMSKAWINAHKDANNLFSRLIKND